MKRICKWCDNEIDPQADRRRIAQGICTNCSEHMTFQMGVPLQTFLDSLPAPIFVINDEGVVQGANRLGYVLLNKEPNQVRNLPGGVVFECAYARLPEGCGRTVHCSGCTIRRTVFKTFETGESQIEVPATLRYGSVETPQHIAMHISTEKMGAVILLRVDRMDEPAVEPERRLENC